MVLDMNIFSSQMKDRVVCQGYESLIIAFQWDDYRCTAFRIAPPPRSKSRSLWIAWTLVFYLETLMRVYCLSGWSSSSFIRNSRSHVASFATRVRAIYLASVDNRATVDCFFKHQVTGPSLSMKIKPEVNFRLSLSPAQSESEYPSMRSLSWLPNVIPCSLEPLRYRGIVLTASMCWWPGFLSNRAATEVVKAMSGLVSTMENIIELVIPWYFSFSAAVA